MLVSNSGRDRNACRCGTDGCNRSLATVLASQTRGHAMNFFVEAKHPHTWPIWSALAWSIRTRGSWGLPILVVNDIKDCQMGHPHQTRPATL
jgi:hypothetical protein